MTNLRGFDRKILRNGQAAHRVLETVPYCWMCSATSGPQTREHIFASSLQDRFPKEKLRFEPTRWAMGGVVLASHRGPFAGNSLVVGNVCGACNNGWMSRLEAEAAPLLVDEQRLVAGRSAETLARWLAKTAVIINVSQTYRLLWPRHARHRIQFGLPPNIRISLHRANGSDLNWMQGAYVQTASSPSRLDPVTLQRVLNMVHICQVQVGTLVGVVVRLPWEISDSTVDMPGIALWPTPGNARLDLAALPLRADAFGCEFRLDLRPSLFWAPRQSEVSHQPSHS